MDNGISSLIMRAATLPKQDVYVMQPSTSQVSVSLDELGHLLGSHVTRIVNDIAHHESPCKLSS